jgi:Protein of unknown function (DUF998)
MKFFMPLGMVGVVFYLLHTILGNLLWPEYNPITTDISSLTADGAPNTELLRGFGMVYGICMILMASALIFKAFREYHSFLKAGSVILLIMQVASFIGYRLFPLTGDKTEMSFQNAMHLVVTLIVVFTTIAASFLLALGFLKQERIVRLGKLSLSFAILITLFGVLNPISMNLGLNILGLTERMVIYTIQAFMFVLSFYYTFLEKKAVQE